MPGTVTPTGGATHGLAALTDAERQAAQRALARLKSPGSGTGLHLTSALESATVSSGSLSKGPATVGLGTSTLIHGHGSDTFIGGVRGTSPTTGITIGNDTVISGSTMQHGGHPARETLSGRSAEPFSLSADTINIAGATAAGIQAGQLHSTAQAHTITLADKTTITIAGLSPHDITKLHH